jgi:hypothetical protein
LGSTPSLAHVEEEGLIHGEVRNQFKVGELGPEFRDVVLVGSERVLCSSYEKKIRLKIRKNFRKNIKKKKEYKKEK